MRTRSLSALLLVLLCLALLCVRMAVLSLRLAETAAAQPRTRTLPVGTTRGKIYARDGSLLVDRTERLKAAVSPCGETRTLLERTLGADAAQKEMETRAPLLLDVDEAVTGENVRTFSVPRRYTEGDLAAHLVGTLDAQENGATGIERAFDDLLTAKGGSLSVRFFVNAQGQVLAGLDKEVIDRGFNSRAGVVLTVDPNAQQIVEDTLRHSKMESGCAVLLDTDTGEVRALASVPGFDRNDLSSAPDGAQRNKALGVYAPGSVMKPLLAAFALEQGVSQSKHFICPGHITVGDTTFRCYGGKAHGRQTMGEALQNSCNVYFIRLLQTLDAGAYLQFLRTLGFGDCVPLCENLRSEAGILPPLAALQSPGQRALLAFGQGVLLVSPLHLVQAYHVLATGKLVLPTVLFGTADEKGAVIKAPKQPSSQVLSENTVAALRSMLTQKAGVSRAYTPAFAVAGKTGTAQSGAFRNGKEICRTWFCSFFPAGNPHYVLVLLNEDGETGSADCAPVCKEICERLVGYAADS